MPKAKQKDVTQVSKEVNEKLASSTGSVNHYAVEVIALLGIGTLIYATMALLLTN